METASLAGPSKWNNRLKAVTVGLALALTSLTVRHWYETFSFGHPLCENCRPDFPQFYAAAKLVWQAPSVLYDEASQLAIQRAVDSRIGESILPYTYPPIAAALLMPLGWLPFPAAFAVMTLLNVILLLLSLRMLIGRLQLAREQATWLILSALCNFGVHSVFVQGQASFILLVLLAIFTFSVNSGSPIGSGLSSALVFLKPQLQIVPFIVLMSRGMWRAVAIAAITVMAFVIFSVTLVGWPGIQQYLSLLGTYLTIERGYGSYPEAMHNLRALAQYAVPFSWSRYLWLALLLPVIASTFLLNAQRFSDQKRTAVQWIGNFAAAVLITPHLYPHDLSLLIVPAGFALKLYGQPVPIWLILLLVAIGIFPLLPLAFGNGLPPMVPVILLIIFVCCARYLRRLDAPSR